MVALLVKVVSKSVNNLIELFRNGVNNSKNNLYDMVFCGARKVYLHGIRQRYRFKDLAVKRF
jgi:hypothetical protein